MTITGITRLESQEYTSRQVDLQQLQQTSEEEVAEQAATVQAASNSQILEQTDVGVSAYDTGAATLSTGTDSTELLETLLEDTTSDNQTLLNKANSGVELTSSELSQLKELDAALYSMAVKAQAAREQARSEMKQAPSNAAEAARAAVQTQESGDEEEQALVYRAVQDEFRQYSAKFDQADFSAAARVAAYMVD